MVEVIHERLFTAIVCCDIDPKRSDCYDELDKQLQRIPNGTTGGWKALRPSDVQWCDACAPLPCSDIVGRWHYVVIC